MPEMLTFSEAARRAGVSRQRLNRAIHLGNLPAQRGGGPGKLTHISLDDLQRWCANEGLAVPVESPAYAAHAAHTPAVSTAIDVPALMTRLEERIEQAIARAVEQVVEQVTARISSEIQERLASLERAEHVRRPAHEERLRRPERTRHPSRLARADNNPKAALIARMRALKEQGLTWQMIADQLNVERVPTLSGKGKWQRGTVWRLLDKGRA
jgi:excisionase family DNA binding protein